MEPVGSALRRGSARSPIPGRYPFWARKGPLKELPVDIRETAKDPGQGDKSGCQMGRSALWQKTVYAFPLQTLDENSFGHRVIKTYHFPETTKQTFSLPDVYPLGFSHFRSP